MKPDIAVFIPIWKEPKKLLEQNAKVFNNLECSYYTKIYWLVHITDTETLKRIDTVKRGKIEVLVIPQEFSPSKGNAINRAFLSTKPKVLAVFDIDAIPEEGFLDAGYKLIMEEKLDAVQGERRIYNATKNVLTKFRTLDFEVSDGLYKKGFCLLLGNGMMINGDTFYEMGGFFNSIVEDLELSFRLHNVGKQVRRMNKRYWEEAPEEFLNFLRQDIRWKSGAIYMNIFREIPKSSPAYKIYSNRYMAYFLLGTLIWWGLFVADILVILAVPSLFAKLAALSHLTWSLFSDIRGNRCYINYLAELKGYPIKATPKLVAFYFLRDKIIYPAVVVLSFIKAHTNPHSWYHTKHRGLKLKELFKWLLGAK